MIVFLIRRIIIVSSAILLISNTACNTWTQNKKSAITAYNYGITFHETGKLEAAVEAYRKALASRPNMAAASFNLALTLSRLGHHDEALEILQKLRQKDMKNLTLIRAQGWVSLQKGRAKEALLFYFEALSIFEGDMKSIQRIVAIYEQLQQIEDAIEYQKMLLRFSDTAENHILLSHLYALNDSPEDVLMEYRWSFSKGYSAPHALLAAGELAEDFGFFGEAEGYYKRVIQSEPQEAWFRLAYLQLTKFLDFKEGIEALKNALEQGFDDDEKLHQLFLEVQPELIPVIQDLISAQDVSLPEDVPLKDEENPEES